MNFLDPVVLICAGVIFVGLFFLLWAVMKLRKKSDAVSDLDLPPLEEHEDVLVKPPEEPVRPTFAPEPRKPEPKAELPKPEPVRAPEPAKPVPSMTIPATGPGVPAQVVSKEMSDRLESMSSRLNEMQAVLSKAMNAAPAGPPPAAGTPPPGGAVGQGFSADTIDKLLKIIGNVIQQVDVLQKSLNTAKPAPSPSPSATSIPASSPASAPAKAPGPITIVPPGATPPPKP